MKNWYRATFRTISKTTWCRHYYDRTNVHLCPKCGADAERTQRYWKLVKRTQHVWAPVTCYECKETAPENPNPKQWHRPMWRKL